MKQLLILLLFIPALAFSQQIKPVNGIPHEVRIAGNVTFVTQLHYHGLERTFSVGGTTVVYKGECSYADVVSSGVVGSFVGSTWYVRPSGGDYGDEDGTSYANAWDGFTNIDWTTAGVQPGDTLYVCGIHTEGFNILGSGTFGRPITIKGNYPSDTCIIDGEDTRNTNIDINNRSYVTFIEIASIDALVDCWQARGASSNLITTDCIFTGSGNQGIQHEGAASATHNNPYCNDNVDDGISGHDSATIVVISGTITANDQGINVVGKAKCTVSGTTTFASNVTNDLLATSATTAESCWINVTDATLPTDVSAISGGKLILTNCTVSGTLNVATTGTGFLTASGCTFSGAVVYDNGATISDTNSDYTSTTNSNDGSVAVFDGCSFDNNVEMWNVTADDCVFATAQFTSGGRSTLTNCLIINYNGNIYGTQNWTGCCIKDNTSVNGSLTAQYCLFEGGADHLLDCQNGSTIDIQYCIFDGMNSGDFGIAARTGTTVTAINGCTFVGASTTGKGIYAQVNATINNCIFTDLEMGVHQNGGTVVTYNACFYGNTGNTTGTVTENSSQTGDPVLSNVSGNDFSLGVGSSCIGNGKDLGTSVDDGIDTANWGNGTDETPSVTTKQQAASWDIGAYLN